MLNIGVGAPSPLSIESCKIDGANEVLGYVCWLRAPIQKRIVKEETAISSNDSQESAAAVAAAMTTPWE
jgi:hypothetical protein